MVLFLQEVDGEDEMENLQKNMTWSAFISNTPQPLACIFNILPFAFIFREILIGPWEKNWQQKSSKDVINRGEMHLKLQCLAQYNTMHTSWTDPGWLPLGSNNNCFHFWWTWQLCLYHIHFVIFLNILPICFHSFIGNYFNKTTRHKYGKPIVAIFNNLIYIQFSIYIYVIFFYSFNLIFIFVYIYLYLFNSIA